VGEIVLPLAPLATMAPDKRRAILRSSSQRAELLPLAERLVAMLRSLEQIDPRPEIEVLRSALLPPWQPAKTPAMRKTSARR
jgi:hypothetical protein